MTEQKIITTFRGAIRGLSTADQVRALAWMYRAIDGDDETERGLLAGILDGTFQITSIEEDGPRFKLTAAGHDSALDLIHENPDLRRLYEGMLKRPVSDPPKGAQ
jgi:hypothetical protein